MYSGVLVWVAVPTELVSTSIPSIVNIHSLASISAVPRSKAFGQYLHDIVVEYVVTGAKVLELFACEMDTQIPYPPDNCLLHRTASVMQFPSRQRAHHSPAIS
jgi:hypothetical protein